MNKRSRRRYRPRARKGAAGDGRIVELLQLMRGFSSVGLLFALAARRGRR